MKSEFKKTLSQEESDRLDALTKSLDKLKKDYSDASIERLDLETQKQNLEQEIRTTLYPRRDQLKSRSVDDEDNQLDERRKELETLKAALADILARQKKTEKEVEKIATQMREKQASLTELQVYSIEMDNSNFRPNTLRLHVKSNEIKSLLNKVWQSVQHCFISAMSAIKAFEILVCFHKKPTKNTRAPSPASFSRGSTKSKKR